MNTTHRFYVLWAAVGLGALLLAGCRADRWGPVAVSPSLEDLTPDGSLYTPSTQSFLRGRHWLETVETLTVEMDDEHKARLSLASPQGEHRLDLVRVPLDYLVPRLGYPPATPPDAFDAFNLMLAEYSRNSLSVPVGKPGDRIAHFETSLPEAVPWALVADYQFDANPYVRPVRVAVVNNCLRPGLWELSASDRSGELYHAWFDMPEALYTRLLAEVNGVDEAFAAQATAWHVEPVAMDLARLRTVEASLGRVPLDVRGGADAGYSSQDSRRKLAKRYVLVEKDSALVKPERLSDLTASPVHMSNFVEPGKYALEDRRTFDLAFLADVQDAEVRRVTPHTDYSWRAQPAATPRATPHLELTLNLREASIVIGNLPMDLLVPQEDFVINGFGVGVLSSGEPAERRYYLIEEGPAPSFAYLYRTEGEQMMALNSHEFGIEQIFIRTHIRDAEPWWEITVTSFERIVDLVKYRVPIPAALTDELNTYALEYISPLYRTYRDDNLR